MLKTAERAVAKEIGEAATGESAARAVVKVYETLSQHLSPVLGDVGVQALFSRSLRLIKPRFPFLGAALTNQQTAPLLDQLRSCLVQQEPTVTRDVGVALLTTFVGLLATLIGEHLVWKFLRDAWPDAVPADSVSPEKK